MCAAKFSKCSTLQLTTGEPRSDALLECMDQSMIGILKGMCDEFYCKNDIDKKSNFLEQSELRIPVQGICNVTGRVKWKILRAGRARK